MSLQGAFAYAYLNALRQDENARIYGRLTGWLAGLLGWLGWLVGWLVGSPGKGREGRSKAFLYAEGIGAYVAFSAFSTVKFLFFHASSLQVPSTLSVKGVAGPDQTFHPTPLSPPLSSPNRLTFASLSLSFTFLFLYFMLAPLSLSISFSCPFFPFSFFCTGLNTGRNEAVKMFRHAQFIIGCEW